MPDARWAWFAVPVLQVSRTCCWWRVKGGKLLTSHHLPSFFGALGVERAKDFSLVLGSGDELFGCHFEGLGELPEFFTGRLFSPFFNLAEERVADPCFYSEVLAGYLEVDPTMLERCS